MWNNWGLVHKLYLQLQWTIIQLLNDEDSKKPKKFFREKKNNIGRKLI